MDTKRRAAIGTLRTRLTDIQDELETLIEEEEESLADLPDELETEEEAVDAVERLNQAVNRIEDAIAELDAAVGDEAASIASRIAQEILSGGNELEVGLGANGQRSVPTLQPIIQRTERRAATGITERGLWVVSGGARGVCPWSRCAFRND